MLVAMETEDGLRRGAVMVVAKIFDWHVQSKSMYQLDIINSPEFCLCKKACYVLPHIFFFFCEVWWEVTI